jgi:hypothetical protein
MNDKTNNNPNKTGIAIGVGQLLDHGYLDEAIELLKAWKDNDCEPSLGEDVEMYANLNSGYVFLSDESLQVIMLNDDKPEYHYSTPYNGHEGFADELISGADANWHEEDIDYLVYMNIIPSEMKLVWEQLGTLNLNEISRDIHNTDGTLKDENFLLDFFKVEDHELEILNAVMDFALDNNKTSLHNSLLNVQEIAEQNIDRGISR